MKRFAGRWPLPVVEFAAGAPLGAAYGLCFRAGDDEAECLHLRMAPESESQADLVLHLLLDGVHETLRAIGRQRIRGLLLAAPTLRELDDGIEVGLALFVREDGPGNPAVGEGPLAAAFLRRFATSISGAQLPPFPTRVRAGRSTVGAMRIDLALIDGDPLCLALDQGGRFEDEVVLALTHWAERGIREMAWAPTLPHALGAADSVALRRDGALAGAVQAAPDDRVDPDPAPDSEPAAGAGTVQSEPEPAPTLDEDDPFATLDEDLDDLFAGIPPAPAAPTAPVPAPVAEPISASELFAADDEEPPAPPTVIVRLPSSATPPAPVHTEPVARAAAAAAEAERAAAAAAEAERVAAELEAERVAAELEAERAAAAEAERAAAAAAQPAPTVVVRATEADGAAARLPDAPAEAAASPVLAAYAVVADADAAEHSVSALDAHAFLRLQRIGPDALIGEVVAAAILAVARAGEGATVPAAIGPVDGDVEVMPGFAGVENLVRCADGATCALAVRVGAGVDAWALEAARERLRSGCGRLVVVELRPDPSMHVEGWSVLGLAELEELLERAAAVADDGSLFSAFLAFSRDLQAVAERLEADAAGDARAWREPLRRRELLGLFERRLLTGAIRVVVAQLSVHGWPIVPSGAKVGGRRLVLVPRSSAGRAGVDVAVVDPTAQFAYGLRLEGGRMQLFAEAFDPSVHGESPVASLSRRNDFLHAFAAACGIDRASVTGGPTAACRVLALGPYDLWQGSGRSELIERAIETVWVLWERTESGVFRASDPEA
ncbi:MAG: hypothetical protein RIT45_3 [Pseudomonadota bacterium]